jgi:hypothetical protein
MQTDLASDGGKHKFQSAKFNLKWDWSDSINSPLKSLKSCEINDSQRAQDIALRHHVGSAGFDLIEDRITDEKTRAAVDPE